MKEAAVVCELVARISEQCVAQDFSVLVTTPYATQRALFEHGAPCDPSSLKRKELRTKMHSRKIPRKEIRTGPDGQRYTTSEGVAPPLDLGREADDEDAGCKRRRPDTHTRRCLAWSHMHKVRRSDLPPFGNVSLEH